MNVLFLTKIIEYFAQRIEEMKKEFPKDTFLVPKVREEIEHMIEKADVIVSGSLSEYQVNKAVNLKYIIVPWAGVNGLPLDIIKSRNIIVCNNHGNGRIVAERALALALSVMGRVVEFHNDLCRGIWHGYEAGAKKEDFWFSLQGKRVSILGLGTIGQHIARLLSGFECEVMGYKRNMTLVDGVKYITTNIDEAIDFGDVIFVALPLTKSTIGVIDKERLRRMNGKFLINVGRGQLIDEEGLYLALKENILAGAGIDTWYIYPSNDHQVQLPSHYPIHTLKNVVISPHVGGFTIEGQKGRIDETVENLRLILSGRQPKNIVDLELEY
ncbi:MAG: 2-hydroxyacid dehydrogenase [Fervidobacterium sp.]